MATAVMPSVDGRVSAIAFSPTFRNHNHALLVGTVEGKVFLLKSEEHSSKPMLVLDTQGAAVTAMKVFDSSKFGSADLVVGDGRGCITIVSNGQVLQHENMAGAIKTLHVHTFQDGSFFLLAGDAYGTLLAFRPHQQLWKRRLCDISPEMELNGAVASEIVCIATLADCDGEQCHYVFVAHGNHVLGISQGFVAFTIETPVSIVSLCVGRFLQSKGLLSDVAAVGCNGTIYVLDILQSQATPLCSVNRPVTMAVTLPAVAAAGGERCDRIACADSTNVLVAVPKEKPSIYPMEHWITSMEATRTSALHVSLSDNSVHTLKIS